MGRELKGLSSGEAFDPLSGPTTKRTLLPVKTNCWTTSPIGIGKLWLKFWLKITSSGNSTHLVRNTTEDSSMFFTAIIEKKLTDGNMTTTVCGVEQKLNVRPLIPANADATDANVLTPNYFLIKTAGSSLPSSLRSYFDLRKRDAHSQAISDAIWSRWWREYSLTLKDRSNWSSSADRDLTGGDLGVVRTPRPGRAIWSTKDGRPRPPTFGERGPTGAAARLSLHSLHCAPTESDDLSWPVCES